MRTWLFSLILISFAVPDSASAVRDCKFVLHPLRLVATPTVVPVGPAEIEFDYKSIVGPNAAPASENFSAESFESLRSDDKRWVARLSSWLAHKDFDPAHFTLYLGDINGKLLLPALLLDFPQQPTAVEIIRRWKLMEGEFKRHGYDTVQMRSFRFPISNYVEWVNSLGVVKAAEILIALEKIGFSNIEFGDYSPANLEQIYPLSFDREATLESRAFRKILTYYLMGDVTKRSLQRPNSDTGATLSHRYAKRKDLESMLTIDRLWPGSSTWPNQFRRKPIDELSIVQRWNLLQMRSRLPEQDSEKSPTLLFLFVRDALKEREENFPSEMRGTGNIDSQAFQNALGHLQPAHP